jgi:NADPH:quinone reductase-like Zn-dependent oxidoreductase
MDKLYWLPDLKQHAQVELVGMPIVFATALYSLRDVARLLPGERVLLHSATGGVGLAAIQVARYLGAEILATAGSPEKRDYLRSLGIQHVMESRSLDFADQIMAATNGHGVDVVLNFLSGEALEKSLSVLAPFGRLVEIGKRDIEENSRLPLRAFNRGLSFTAVDLDRMAAARPGLLRALLHEIWDGIRQGVFRPVPVQVFSAAEITRACRIMLKAEHIGKVVVQMADQMVSAIPMQPKMSLSDNAKKPVLVCDPLPG